MAARLAARAWLSSCEARGWSCPWEFKAQSTTQLVNFKHCPMPNIYIYLCTCIHTHQSDCPKMSDGGIRLLQNIWGYGAVLRHRTGTIGWLGDEQRTAVTVARRGCQSTIAVRDHGSFHTSLIGLLFKWDCAQLTVDSLFSRLGWWCALWTLNLHFDDFSISVDT